MISIFSQDYQTHNRYVDFFLRVIIKMSTEVTETSKRKRETGNEEMPEEMSSEQPTDINGEIDNKTE